MTYRGNKEIGDRYTMRTMLGKLKRRFASALKSLIVDSQLPLAAQTWAIKHLLPMDPWPKSLAYQQCLADRIIKSQGATSQTGPFNGMACIKDANDGCLVPKLLGCYEEELFPTVESFILRGYDRILDVGCASGYWLVGLALRMPRAELFGFDIDEGALARCSELIALNNVQPRVKLLGICTPTEIEKLIKGRTLIFMDCDGPEFELLDPNLAPALRRADIIVECHDCFNPMITPTLLERFEVSHLIERISSREREPRVERYPGLKALPSEHWAEALAERRPCVQEWLVMRSTILDQNSSGSDLESAIGRPHDQQGITG